MLKREYNFCQPFENLHLCISDIENEFVEDCIRTSSLPIFVDIHQIVLWRRKQNPESTKRYSR